MKKTILALALSFPQLLFAENGITARVKDYITCQEESPLRGMVCTVGLAKEALSSPESYRRILDEVEKNVEQHPQETLALLAHLQTKRERLPADVREDYPDFGKRFHFLPEDAVNLIRRGMIAASIFTSLEGAVKLGSFLFAWKAVASGIRHFGKGAARSGKVLRRSVHPYALLGALFITVAVPPAAEAAAGAVNLAFEYHLAGKLEDRLRQLERESSREIAKLTLLKEIVADAVVLAEFYHIADAEKAFTLENEGELPFGEKVIERVIARIEKTGIPEAEMYAIHLRKYVLQRQGLMENINNLIGKIL